MSTSNLTFSTQDLRSGSVDYHRDHTHKAKWQHGQSWGPGRRLEDNHPRPARPDFREAPGIRRDGVSAATHKARVRERHTRDIQNAHLSGDSSAEDDVDEPSAAPAPDADITYSFDATRGPGQGSQILSLALDKAIERFEVRATDRLIKEEYEVLGHDGEPVLTRSSAKGKKPIQAMLDDDDYELV